MRMYHYANSLAYFSAYNWYLRSLNAKNAERRKIRADIREGLISRDMLDPDWEETMDAESAALRAQLDAIEATVESMPETARLLPCKLYLRLHFISGLSVTETAEKLNVSETTLRRIRNRAARYFDEHPPQ